MSLDYIFFFSSRRRHTRSLRDWSSDVCSSDLLSTCGERIACVAARTKELREHGAAFLREHARAHLGAVIEPRVQIGRASCRERVTIGGGRVMVKSKVRQATKMWKEMFM